MTPLDYFGARAAAGRAALSIADDHSRQDAAEIVRGAMHGFLLACTQFDGWDRLLHDVNQLAAEARVPSVSEKPSLRVVKGEVA